MSKKADDFWEPIRPLLREAEDAKRPYEQALGAFLVVFNNFERNAKVLLEQYFTLKRMENFYKKRIYKPNLMISDVISHLNELSIDDPQLISIDFASVKRLLIFRNEVTHSPLKANARYEDGKTEFWFEVDGKGHLPNNRLQYVEFEKNHRAALAINASLERQIFNLEIRLLQGREATNNGNLKPE